MLRQEQCGIGLKKDWSNTKQNTDNTRRGV